MGFLSITTEKMQCITLNVNKITKLLLYSFIFQSILKMHKLTISDKNKHSLFAQILELAAFSF